ncbi:MAG: hypothetical protein ACOY93_07390 [Bacillota bacterium]
MEDLVQRLVQVALLVSVGASLAGYGLAGRLWGAPAALAGFTLWLWVQHGPGALGIWLFMLLPVLLSLLGLYILDRRVRERPAFRWVRPAALLAGAALFVAGIAPGLQK